jgi:hypothetical protein
VQPSPELIDNYPLKKMKTSPQKSQSALPTQPLTDDEPEPLTPDVYQQAQPLVEVFGELAARQLFSRTWQFRESGIASVEETVRDNLSSDDYFLKGVQVVSLTIGDKIIGVILASMNLLVVICSEMSPKLSPRDQEDVAQSGGLILSVLVEKLGDNLIKARKGADEAILAMSRCPAFGVKLVVDALTKAGPKKVGSKSTNSNKQTAGKYNTLYKILQDSSRVKLQK